ncbi:SH3 domain containing, Ysc84-like 1 (Saccharomyces cerevisiae) [Seminavis robusta]|uniref:SH3 domain containing, Ysc84-like 1 (Saccharomyces cerevisiae) n=1 Tax=Seminavis robusta TaxID=568900 RepID=A0A9N8E8F7_9STRA|nr:SH3 domain containing, Ysc84-like 1 (Saccharomyces cerevisiae) [Seminavis robusta]|eukprot:Sro797_g203940.1 SH3 domain containing, Ysc84-like 1 (Saccharomyces cerevisiae) (176) ;mRNA; r:42607-43134
MSLEGSVVSVRNDVNAKFYGRQVSPKALLNTPGPKAAEPLYKALDGAMQGHIPNKGFRPSTLFNGNAAAGCDVYQNHPQRPVYLNQHCSSPPPPVIPVPGCFGHADTDTPPQQIASGSMESYHTHSHILPGGHTYQQPQFGSIRPQTIETINPGPQPLFDASSPGSAGGGYAHGW